MRAWPLVPLLLASVGCNTRLVRHASVGTISLRGNARVVVAPPPATATVTTTTTTTTTTTGTTGQVVVTEPPPPPPPPVLVEIQGAPVVEFFGIPLEGAQDVVFVLDTSGSMANWARGRLAEIAAAPPTPMAPPPPVGPPPSQEPPPAYDPNAAPAYDPNAAPADPNAAPPADPYAADPNAAQPAAPAVVQRRKIDVAQAELIDALQKLPTGTRMNVLFFNNELEAFAPGMFTLDDNGRVSMISYVDETEPSGSTALAPAMRTAFMMNARRIVLLSDGLGNVGGGVQEILRDAREAMRGGVRIDTIGLGSGQDSDLLDSLARESGGLYQAL